MIDFGHLVIESGGMRTYRMPEPSKDRADRILDAAASLLIRYRYRKVTDEDVARQAGIGKGTVYLHWRTKEKTVRSRDSA